MDKKNYSIAPMLVIKLIYFSLDFYLSMYVLIHKIKDIKLQSMPEDAIMAFSLEQNREKTLRSSQQEPENTQAQAQMEELDLSPENELKKIICALLKSSDDYGLSKTTKYLAREICFRYISNFPAFLTQETELLMISSLRLAVKFNQNLEISSSYTVDCCVTQSQGRYSPEDFVKMELNLLKNMNFNLYIRSPYDYLQENASSLGFDETQIMLVETAIDYTLSLIEYVMFTGEEIFAFCMAAIFQQRKKYSLRIFNYLSNLYRKIPNLLANACEIRKAIFDMDEEPEDSSELIY